MTHAAAARLQAWETDQYARLQRFSPVAVRGRVQRVNGILLQCRLPQAQIGDLCQVERDAREPLLAEIVGFDQHDALLSALGGLEGVRVGAAVQPLGMPHRVQVGHFGRPLLDGGVGAFADASVLHASVVIGEAPAPTARPRIQHALTTGVRAIDGPLTLGEGQRVGLFAGAGCGKTTLLAEIGSASAGASCANSSITNSTTNCVPARCWSVPPPTAPAWSAPALRSRRRRWPRAFVPKASACCC